MAQYAEGIASLKRYELHPKLGKDPKKQQHLIDIYYSETSMNNFKTSVITQLEKLNTRMAALEKDFVQYSKLVSPARPKTPDSSEYNSIKSRFEMDLKWKKDVLIQSIFTAIFEDLRTAQQHMRQFESSLLVPSDFVRQISKKQDAIKSMLQEANLHLKTFEAFYEELLRLKERTAREVFKTKLS